MTNTLNNIDAAELNNRIDPVELLTHIGYHKSKPKTSNGETRDFCPIHGGDKQQSLAISQENHTYYCHSCFEGGDLIDLYCKAKKIEFKDAIVELASIFHVYPSVFQERSNYTKEKPPTKPPAKELPTLDDYWNKGIEEGIHPYLEKKKVPCCPGIKIGEDQKGNNSIMVPYSVFDSNKKIRMQTLQFVNEKGKYFLEGYSSKGAFFVIGELQKGCVVYLAEGLATCITIWLAKEKKHPVISFGSAGNMSSVRENLLEYDPTLQIIIVLDKGEAALKAMKKTRLPFKYTVPNFDGLTYPEGKDPNDMNDLISLCNQPLEEVSRQLDNLQSPEIEPEQEPEDFFSRLERIIGDHSLKLKDRTYEKFEEEHKALFSGGVLITGYEEFDEEVYFAKGDFITIQAMSNHGKSTLMLKFAHSFITNPENNEKNPMCIFITYESSPLAIEEKLLNMIAKETQEGTILKYDRKAKEKFLYPNKIDFKKTIGIYNYLQSLRKISLLKRISLEKLESLIDLYKEEFPNRTLVFFLDYIQIIETSVSLDGWERIKEVAKQLEILAIEKEVIIFSASQVNDKRQARESRDIYNYSTTNIDLLNHSHPLLLANKDLEKYYKPQVDGKDLCTLSVFKQKHGSSIIKEDYLLFDGHNFYENKPYQINQNSQRSTGGNNAFGDFK